MSNGVANDTFDGRFVGVFGAAAAVLLAVALRAGPLWAGLPQQHRGPEEHRHLEIGLDVARGHLDHGWYVYPPLRFTALGLALRAAHGEAVATDPRGAWSERFARTSRALSLAFGLGAVLAMVAGGRALAGPAAGALAGLLTALDPLHLEASTETSVDACLSFCVALALWRVVVLCRRPTGANAAAAGIAAGLAAATKQPGVLLFPIVAVACLATRPRSEPGATAGRGSRPAVGAVLAALAAVVVIAGAAWASAGPQLIARAGAAMGVEPTAEQLEFGARMLRSAALKLALAGLAGLTVLGLSRSARRWLGRALADARTWLAMAAGATTLLACCPFMVLHYRRALRDQVYLAYHGVKPGWSGGLAENLAHFGAVFASRYGPPWLVAAAVAAALAVRRRDAAGLIVALAGLLYVLAFAGTTIPFDRYLLPVAHAGALLAAAALASAWHSLSSRASGPTAWVALLAIALAPIGLDALRTSRGLTEPDASVLALRWIGEHLPAGASIVRIAQTPQTETLGDRFRTDYLSYKVDRLGPEYLAARGADYVILSEVVAISWRAAPSTYAEELRGYDWARSQLELVKEFRTPGRPNEPGIAIYRVGGRTPRSTD